jgi:hypothetical protein
VPTEPRVQVESVLAQLLRRFEILGGHTARERFDHDEDAAQGIVLDAHPLADLLGGHARESRC